VREKELVARTVMNLDAIRLRDRLRDARLYLLFTPSQCTAESRINPARLPTKSNTATSPWSTSQEGRCSSKKRMWRLIENIVLISEEGSRLLEC